MSPDQLRVYEEIIGGPRETVVGALCAAIHRPELADRWQKFDALLNYEASLPYRLSEMVILVTARRWNSQAQWQVHVRHARKAGVPEPVIDAIKHGRSPEFHDKREAAIYDFARELLEFGEVSTDLYQRVLLDLEAVGVVELTAMVGYYTMVAMALSAHEIPLPHEGAPPLDLIGTNGDAAAHALTHLAPARVTSTA